MPGVPGQVCIVCPGIDGAHDEEDVGEDGGRIDAEGDGGDIAAAFPVRQAARLPGVEEVSCEDGDRRTGQDAAGDEAQGKAADGRQAHDQEKIRKAAEEEAEEAVHVSGCEPGQISLRGSCHQAGFLRGSFYVPAIFRQ